MNRKALYTIPLLALVPVSTSAQSLEDRIERLVDSVYHSNEDALGILIHVESPDHSLSWSKAVGFSDSSRTRSLQANQPVLVASNTKSYVSATVLRLVENGNFQLDDPVSSLLSNATQALFSNDGYNLDSITVRHLLSHTSGIQDYVDDDYFDEVIEHPQRVWKKEEQLARSIEVGSPLFTPGSEFSYGDINYLLLTEIIELQTQKPFYQAVRELLKYEELGLDQTWFKDLETPNSEVPPFAHQYANDYLWDSYEINHSWDLYGAGGIAATVKDAALFYQLLFEGQIIESEEVLTSMYSYVLPPEKSRYCLGIYHFDLGFHLYYHGGWWGTDVNYCPETNTSIAVFTLVREKRNDTNPFLGKHIHDVLLQQ